MNLFILLRGVDGGDDELVTPPLSTGVILPGVTRRSIIELTQTWPGLKVSERKITMGEVMEAQADGRLLEMFGSGTAAVVSPVGGLHYGGQLHSINTPEEGLAVRIMAAMSDIYYGRVQSPWAVDVEEWNVDRTQVSGGAPGLAGNDGGHVVAGAGGLQATRGCHAVEGGGGVSDSLLWL